MKSPVSASPTLSRDAAGVFRFPESSGASDDARAVDQSRRSGLRSFSRNAIRRAEPAGGLAPGEPGVGWAWAAL